MDWPDSSILWCMLHLSHLSIILLTLYSNHPVIKEDGVLAVFLTEPSFENWRKHNAILYEEESASKRIERVEEMAIPSDLEAKLK